MNFQANRSVNINSQRLDVITKLFNITLSNDLTNMAPFIKVGLIGNYSSIFDRFFTTEENKIMLTFVRNVKNTDDDDAYKRSAYMIVRKKTRLIHFRTGLIFDDVFDYAHIEQTELYNFGISFYYNDKYYTNINDISSIDPEYKQKTIICYLNNSNQIVMENHIHTYCYLFGNFIDKKVGFYIPDENIEYLHVIHHFKSSFGLIADKNRCWAYLDNNDNNLNILINQNFINPATMKEIKYTKKGTVKNEKDIDNFIHLNLISKIKSVNDYQIKRLIIGWFISEILYSYIFCFD
jgi:hypothetical protein